ncbi:hypothetical protein CEXT_690291 [Caerostris extrusa]|uniref:Uncharacterized protein n=1 Tax=Caerostris extrusa TaxID=172846 RepID=A0AAV4W5Z1_CAEEX|nr:hypothetical protein CEXT_690291 [Caerostris extrusa]
MRPAVPDFYLSLGAVIPSRVSTVSPICISNTRCSQNNTRGACLGQLSENGTEEFGVLKCASYRTCIATGIAASCIIPLSLFLVRCDHVPPRVEKVLKFYTALHFSVGVRQQMEQLLSLLHFGPPSGESVVSAIWFLLVLSCYILGLLKQTVASFTSVSHHESDLGLFFTAYLRYSETVSKAVSLVNRALSLLLWFMFDL